jgi:hypothetical protein
MIPKTLALAAVLLLGCGPDAAVESADSLKRPPPRKSSDTTCALRTTDAFDPAVAPTWRTGFSVYSTYTLYFATEFTGGVAGHHVESVTLIAPGSMVFQRLDVAFAIGVAATGAEQQAQQTSTGFRVWTSIPVAGTAIQQQSLVGTWSGEVRVDGASAPSAHASFGLY